MLLRGRRTLPKKSSLSSSLSKTSLSKIGSRPVARKASHNRPKTLSLSASQMISAIVGFRKTCVGSSLCVGKSEGSSDWVGFSEGSSDCVGFSEGSSD